MRSTNPIRYARPRRQSYENVVQNDLAVTPSMMMQAAERGVAITAANLSDSQFFDGVPMSEQQSFNLPIDRLRGIDVADCWQASESIRKKAKKGLQQDIKNFGKNPQTE